MNFVIEQSKKGDGNGQSIGVEVNPKEVMYVMIQCEKGLY